MTLQPARVVPVVKREAHLYVTGGWPCVTGGLRLTCGDTRTVTRTVERGVRV